MHNTNIKISNKWECTYCGCFFEGSLSMNRKAFGWLERAWTGHLNDCRRIAATNQETRIAFDEMKKTL